LSPQDEVVPHERHDEEVDEERLAVDDDRGAADDVRACDTLAVGHGGCEARAWLDRQAASSAMKLCVDPVSSSVTRVVSPREARTYMES